MGQSTKIEDVFVCDGCEATAVHHRKSTLDPFEVPDGWVTLGRGPDIWDHGTHSFLPSAMPSEMLFHDLGCLAMYVPRLAETWQAGLAKQWAERCESRLFEEWVVEAQAVLAAATEASLRELDG